MTTNSIKVKRQAGTYNSPPTPPPTSPLRPSNGTTEVPSNQISTRHSTDVFQSRVTHTSKDLIRTSQACFLPDSARNSALQRGIWPSIAVQQNPKLKRVFLQSDNSHYGGSHIFQALRTEYTIAQSDGSALSRQQYVLALVAKTARASVLPVSPKKQTNMFQRIPMMQVASNPEAHRLWIHTLKKGKKNDSFRSEQEPEGVGGRSAKHEQAAGDLTVPDVFSDERRG
ncbi:hypothetical protein FB567DRAFT_593575 [Paraphoma chrysanthemicola]|uniref:Uncharacterized protein n=1 Tax=Paraphoma chrysanthemicola TaxID=798071 RepID=A0A8K0R2R6_9PLEO|nr:hypothetical protein FB567DRAFT_593575 [Paraphoma chrysanthemicola]